VSTTLVCHVQRRFPIAVVTMAGTLDQRSVVRAMVTLRDCLAEAPNALLVDVAHVVVASAAALRPIVTLAKDAQTWPDALVGLCGATANTRALSADLTSGPVPRFYPTVDAGLADALRTPMPRRDMLALAPDADAPARARAFVERVCKIWSVGKVAKLAALVASEMVTNAVIHAKTRAVMMLRLAGQTLHISVRDGDPRPMYRPVLGATGASDQDHGRGLLILDAMADRWGSHPTADGKVVWATISVPPAGDP
jgi:anti-sigma regulatory factor (Ser/Thr protein kinase)